MIQLFLPLSHSSRRKSPDIRQSAQFFHKFSIIPNLCFHSPRPELSQIPLGLLPRRYMEIVRIHRLVRRYQHDRLRLDFPDPFGCFPVGADRILYFLFLPSSHIRHDQWRMGKHKCPRNKCLRNKCLRNKCSCNTHFIPTPFRLNSHI